MLKKNGSSQAPPSPSSGGLIKAMSPPPPRPARPSSSPGLAPVALSPKPADRRATLAPQLSHENSSAGEEEKKDNRKTKEKKKNKVGDGCRSGSSGHEQPAVAPSPLAGAESLPSEPQYRASPPVPPRKGTLRLTDKLKRKSSSVAMGAAVSKDKDSSQQSQQGQQPMQIGGVIAGSFQHHAHVSAAQASTTQDAMDEMLKSINQALEAMGAGGLTADEAKLILANDSASLAKIAQQFQEEAATRQEMSRRKRSPVQAQGPPPSQTSQLLANASAALAPAPAAVPKTNTASVAAAVQASAPAQRQFLAATRPGGASGGAAHSVRRKMLQVQQTLQEANQRLLREVEDLKLAKYAVENENKELKRQVASAAAPSPVHGPAPQLKGAVGPRASAGGMVVDFRTAQTIEKLKKDLDAEWRRAEQLSYVVIDFEERRQVHETEKSRLREENQALAIELDKLRDNSDREGMWMQNKVSNAIEEVKQLKEKLLRETERADAYQQLSNKLKMETSSLAIELETAIASSTAEMSEARERFEQELKRIQSQLYGEMETIKRNAEEEIRLARSALEEKLTITEMYLEEERKIRGSLECARIEAQSRADRLERRLHAHAAAGKGREDLLAKRLALAEEQKQRVEKDLTDLREELANRKGGVSATAGGSAAISSDVLDARDREIAELKRQLEEKNAVIQHQQDLIETSAPDVDEDLALDDEGDGESAPRMGAIAAPPPPPPAAPAPPPPLVASSPIASTLSAPTAAVDGVPGGSFRAIASGNTVASSLRDRLASTKLKKVDHEEVAREKEDNDTSVFNFLARALIARRVAISEEVVDDEEW